MGNCVIVWKKVVCLYNAVRAGHGMSQCGDNVDLRQVSNHGERGGEGVSMHLVYLATVHF